MCGGPSFRGTATTGPAPTATARTARSTVAAPRAGAAAHGAPCGPTTVCAEAALARRTAPAKIVEPTVAVGAAARALREIRAARAPVRRPRPPVRRRPG